MSSSPPPPPRRRPLVWLIAGLVAVAGVAVGGWFLLVAPALDLSRAEADLRRNAPDAALIRLDRYLARRPSDGQALLIAAHAARRADRYADAERWLTDAEKASGPTDDSQLEWTLLGAQQGDIADERRLRAAIAERHPAATAVAEALGKGYLAQYRWAEAAEAAEAVLARDPDHAPALVIRATAAERTRRATNALDDLRRAVAVAPDGPAAHLALAGLLTRSGFTREGIQHFEAALRLRPGDPAALLGLARALSDNADPAEAARRLDELLAAHPDHPDALAERGRLALRQDRPAEAEPLLARAVAAAPWHRDAVRLAAAVYTDLSRTGDAARCQERLAELTAEDALAGRLRLRAAETPDDIGVRWQLWQWHERNGSADEGLAWLSEILRMDPRHPPAHSALAVHFDRIGQPRRAALHRSAAAKGGPR